MVPRRPSEADLNRGADSAAQRPPRPAAGDRPDRRTTTTCRQRAHRHDRPTDTVIAQARIRLAGAKPDSATRLISLHDPDARPIVKGRLGKPIEFGYKAQIVDNVDDLGSSWTTVVMQSVVCQRCRGGSLEIS